jgi:simple sugar transport system permease protein
MLMGAFAGFTVAYYTGSLWLGVLMAVIAGGLLSLVMAFLVATVKVDQTVAGLVINLASAGISLYLYRLSFPNVGSQNLPNLKIFQGLPIPLLSQIPVMGRAFFSQSTLSYAAFLLVPLIYFFLYRTKYGLELRCLGENPRAVDLKGINITLYQYLAVIFGGLMAGAGGAFLTLASSGMFVPDIAAGRGWIAIAIVIFGNWKPFNLMLGALFFGFLDAFQLQIQGLGFQIPYQALIALPYVLTIVMLVVSRNRSGAPIWLGRPYYRE